MFNICPSCGSYSVARKWIGYSNPFDLYACPSCAHVQEIYRASLTVVTGPAGVGKSTACRLLAHGQNGILCVDGDILFVDQFRHHHRGMYEDFVLRACKNFAQVRSPVVLFGTLFPARVIESPEADYFRKVLFIALTSESDVLRKRLKARPIWRESDDVFIEEQLAVNADLRSGSVPGIDVVLQSEIMPLNDVVSTILGEMLNHGMIN